jgi:membrane protease YdiL (CAAX protease family)
MNIVAIFWNSSEKRLRALWRILFQFIVLIWIVAVLSIPVIVYSLLNKSGFSVDDPIISLFSALAMGIAIAVSLWVCGRWIDRRPFASYGFHLSGRWAADLAFGLILGAFLMGFIFGVEYTFGWITISAFMISSTPNTPFILGLVETILLFLLVGTYEESFSRGYQLHNLAEGLGFTRLGPRLSLVIAWFLSSLFFGFLHAANPNASLISTLNLVLAGLFLGLGFVLTGDLAISIGLHITWNFFQGNVFGFPVSGTTPIVSFIGINQRGDNLVTGGAFGPEAGLIGLAAILLGSLLVMAWVYTTRKKLSLDESLAVYGGRNDVLPVKSNPLSDPKTSEQNQ